MFLGIVNEIKKFLVAPNAPDTKTPFPKYSTIVPRFHFQQEETKIEHRALRSLVIRVSLLRSISQLSLFSRGIVNYSVVSRTCLPRNAKRAEPLLTRNA